MTSFFVTEEQVLKRLQESMTNHTPTESQIAKIEAVREAYKQVGAILIANVPASRERAVAITELETSLMWATKAIILNPDRDAQR